MKFPFDLNYVVKIISKMVPALYESRFNLDNYDYAVHICLRNASWIIDAIQDSKTSVSVRDVQKLN